MMDAVGGALGAEDVPRSLSLKRRVGADAEKLPPMPRCADPAGYSRREFAYLRAAGDNASTGTGMGAVELALQPIESAVSLGKKLTAELNRTVPNR